MAYMILRSRFPSRCAAALMKIKTDTLLGNKKFILTTAAVVAGLGSAVVAWRRLLRHSLPPETGQIHLPGLRQPVEIFRDRWGVPHIYAQNDPDLFFAQGFAHAQDRLFQMDIFRRVGAGRVSEIIGPSGLAGDRFARYLGWNKVAETQVANMDDEARDLMAAYCAGVNAYIDRGQLPVEFTLLAYQPEKWHFFDTAVWGAVLTWGLSVNWETELFRSLLLDSVGLKKAADMTYLYRDAYRTIIPATRVGERLARTLLQSYQRAILLMPLGSMPVGRGVGSNNWVVNGQHTQTGRPILANDPHLPPLSPPFWYENHLLGGSYNVIGFSMPGVPGVVIGHNEHVSWGVTNAFPDVQDIYVERFHDQDETLYEFNGRWLKADRVVEKIKVRGRKPIVEAIRYTRHGPVFSDLIPDQDGDLSLQWTSHSPTNQIRCFLDMNKAANWNEFYESLRPWGFASLNIVYADVAGNIAYAMPGLIPKRRTGAGLLPVPGWIDNYEWDGWIPFEELPVYVNPPEGMIVTANNRVHGTTYPHLLTGEWLPDYRARRIWDLLQAHIPLSMAINGRIQSDTVSLPLRRFLQLALDEQNLLQYLAKEDISLLNQLRNWNGDMQVERTEPSIAHGWCVHFTRAVIEQAVGSKVAAQLLEKRSPESFPLNPFLEVATELALNWLEEGCPTWVGEIKPLLAPALQKTLLTLKRELGPNPKKWQWGKLHFIELHHPMVQIPLLGRIWKPVKIPAGGDTYTVDQSEVGLHFPPESVSVMASGRLIIDVGDWDNSMAVLPGGQSGHPASPHYRDGLVDWQNGRYHPQLFTRDRIEQEIAGEIRLIPKALGKSLSTVQSQQD